MPQWVVCSMSQSIGTRNKSGATAQLSLHSELETSWNWVCFIMQIPKIQGGHMKKLGAKNMRTFCRFYTTSDFDHKYLWNESRYPKLERHVTESESTHIVWKKSGEIWSTNYKVGHVSLDPLKWTFWGDNILAHRGAAPSNFYELETDQGLVAQNTSWGMEVTPNFNHEHIKFGLNFSVFKPITSGLMAVLSQNFSRWRAARQGW